MQKLSSRNTGFLTNLQEQDYIFSGLQVKNAIDYRFLMYLFAVCKIHDLAQTATVFEHFSTLRAQSSSNLQDVKFAILPVYDKV